MAGVQSIIFKKANWTQEKAREWLKKHKYKYGKVHKTNNSLRYRQKPPNDRARYRTHKLANRGISLILEYNKNRPTKKLSIK